jgi:hypothetical protein
MILACDNVIGLDLRSVIVANAMKASICGGMDLSPAGFDRAGAGFRSAA